ncbi:hypothetical protein NI17_010380 [Thermobifida halotolerans]|uniref:Uncharacterized protein n=1 Tax=Thermobifida halotolerans TaxID=483545 RepID=A0AA97M0D1_9ACTN|nr:hypothetical protein [Thermobifida halotolerans]UOE21469.1 hypothetical protein NI17_010380 [Thermobifida halotolerans]
MDTAAEVSVRLLTAQIRAAEQHPGQAADWVRRAGFVDTVLAENPDLDTHQVRTALDTVLARLGGIPVSFGHLDYGLPNVFADGVIDWQHHTMPPWFDVYPMLDIAAFRCAWHASTSPPDTWGWENWTVRWNRYVPCSRMRNIGVPTVCGGDSIRCENCWRTPTCAPLHWLVPYVMRSSTSALRHRWPFPEEPHHDRLTHCRSVASRTDGCLRRP